MKHLRTFWLIEAVAKAGSIRKAAEDSFLTASALNRRIKAFEDEFGSEIFERLPRGMRLNPAGELLMQHIRLQRIDMARLQSQVADLSGVRRGHVSIGCSQALLPYFIPREIARYRKDHPGVTFSVNVRDREQAEHDLARFNSDLALVFEPLHMVDFEVLYAVPQPVCAVFASDHPLNRKTDLRLRDCLTYPCIIPAQQYGVRHLLEDGARRGSISLAAQLETESFEMLRHYVLEEKSVGFQIPIGLESDADAALQFRTLSPKDVDVGTLYLGQMKGRTLPVASARFAMQLVESLSRYSTS